METAPQTLPLENRCLDRSPVRTVFLVEDLKFGGTQRQVLDLASHMDKSRFHVEIWAMGAGDDLVPLAENLQVPLVWLSRRSFVGPDSLFALWRRLRSERTRLLVLFTVIPNIWGRLLGRLAKVPVIVGTCRGGAAPWRQHEKLLWRLADHHLCNSRELKDIFVKRFSIPASKVSVIQNGIDLDYFHFSPGAENAGKKVVLCIARFVPDKDHRTLIEAFAVASEKHPEAELWLVGDGPGLEPARRLAMSRLARGGARFFPGRLDPRPILRQSSLFVLSSVKEGLPNVVLEAMASGLPVVATRVGGIPEAVEHGRTGLLVPAGDVRTLASALCLLLADDETRKAYGEAGRKRVEEMHPISGAVSRHEAVFLQLLRDHSHGCRF